MRRRLRPPLHRDADTTIELKFKKCCHLKRRIDILYSLHRIASNQRGAI
eukprot:SAG11_NODE_20115_length_452_cov_1.172805_1_plen_48_part_10